MEHGDSDSAPLHCPGGAGATVSPPHSSFVRPLLTDLYQISMAYAYWDSGRHDLRATFDLYFRSCPFNGTFVAFAGLDTVLQFIQHYALTQDDIAYIRTVLPPTAKEAFFTDFLPRVDCSQITVHARRNGSVAFPSTPLLRVEGPLAAVQLLETTLLNLVGYASLVATNAVRCRLAAGPAALLVEFGLRRAQGPDGGMHASKYSYLGGFDATSNCLAGFHYGIPVRGTHAHAFVQSFASFHDVGSAQSVALADGSGVCSSDAFCQSVCEIRRRLLGSGDKSVATVDGELAAFTSYAMAFPSTFLALVDTYDTLASGVPNFVFVALALHDLGYQAVGIRLDSGDLADLSWRARERIDALADAHFGSSAADASFSAKLIVMASNDLNESELLSLRRTRHAIDAFGIGTDLVTCRAQPALGCVFKLAALDGEPRIKLSEDAGKSTLPGTKDCFRIFECDAPSGRERFVADVLVLSSEGAVVPTAGVPFGFVDEARLRSAPVDTVDLASITTTALPCRVERLLGRVWAGRDGAGAAAADYCAAGYLRRAKAALQDEVRCLTVGDAAEGAAPEGAVGLSLPLVSLIRRMQRGGQQSVK